MSFITKEFKGASAHDILAWHRPVASAISLGAVLGVWFIFAFFQYTFVTFSARILQIAFILGAAAAVTKRAFFDPKDVSDGVDRIYETIRPHARHALECTVRLLTWSDVNKSIEVFVATFVVAFLGNWISDSVLFLIVALLAFSIPAVYEHKKPEIDAQLKKVSDLIHKYLGMLKSKGEKIKGNVEKNHPEASAKIDEAGAEAKSKLEDLARKNE